MLNWRRARPAAIVTVLIVLPIVCGLLFLADSAPRNWSLHWSAPQTLIPATAGTEFAAIATSSGWDVLWTAPSGGMTLSHFDRNNRRIDPDVPIAGTPTNLTLARAGALDVAVWREDYNGGTRLRAALVTSGKQPVYRTLANGSFALEHPYAFTAGAGVDVVFSWQRPVFNIYLTRIAVGRSSFAPRALTHAQSYAYEPRAVMVTQSTLQLLYFDECCSPQSFRLEEARYTAAGQPLGHPQQLDNVNSILQVSRGAVPDHWGLDLQRRGTQIWSAWSSDAGIQVAKWQNGRLAFNQTALPTPPPAELAIVLDKNQREVVWPMMVGSDIRLNTISLGADGLPTSAPDRVVFESGAAAQPQAVLDPTSSMVLWQFSSSSSNARIEESQYSATSIAAPNLGLRLGLGVSNPIGSFFLVLVGAIFFGLLLACANVLVILGLIVLYLLIARAAPGNWRWYAYTAGLAIALYLLLVQAGGPFPPVVGLSPLSSGPTVIALASMVIAVLLLSYTVLRRVDDGYRAAIMAFIAVFFIAFLHALTIVQGQIGSV